MAKINKKVKDLIEGQIEVEGFDYAMTEKISPDDWEDGAIPVDLKESWNKYLKAREEFKDKLRKYQIDPQ